MGSNPPQRYPLDGTAAAVETVGDRFPSSAWRRRRFPPTSGRSSGRPSSRVADLRFPIGGRRDSQVGASSVRTVDRRSFGRLQHFSSSPVHLLCWPMTILPVLVHRFKLSRVHPASYLTPRSDYPCSRFSSPLPTPSSVKLSGQTKISCLSQLAMLLPLEGAPIFLLFNTTGFTSLDEFSA